MLFIFLMYEFFDFATDAGWISAITNNSFVRYKITYYIQNGVVENRNLPI